MRALFRRRDVDRRREEEEKGEEERSHDAGVRCFVCLGLLPSVCFVCRVARLGGDWEAKTRLGNEASTLGRYSRGSDARD